ncbi:MAG: hypothetical protein DHS20C14_21060 [Phycisphaeraceae bacterium]|nr:MAG: hypothetical protein DHS20C14_21060 [Phycisphaeraceae bacterium]
MSIARICGALGLSAIVLAAGACALDRDVARVPALAAPVPAAPEYKLLTEEGVVQEQVFDLTADGAVAWGVTVPEIIDTRDFPVQIQPVGPADGSTHRTKDILPPHTRPQAAAKDPFNGLFPDATISSVPRATLNSQFSALDSSGWNPPDPALAVGPDHVLVTVNQSLAWYTKGGTLQFSAIMGSQGSPGFFEGIGAGNFTFDPKCFYDHEAGRFVIVVLEAYTSTAYITLAISDDSDPNGVWYKYRTDAVINVGADTFWWDYPGAGYDADAYYFTSNLFGLNNNGFAGTGFRVYDKAPLLTGAPAVYATLRDGGSASVQACQHFGANAEAFFVSEGSGTTLRFHAISDPLTAPTLNAVDVAVPGYSGAGSSPVLGGGSISVVGSRIMNCAWRNGNVVAGHSVWDGSKNVARWYEFDMGDWPDSGSPTLDQSGEIDMGSGIYTYFPAVYPNADGSIGMVFGRSSTSERVSMYVTGRNTDDLPGEMGDPVLVRTGTRSGTDGRWGDYYDIAVDPDDGTTFWAVGQTDENGIGWDPRIASFSVIPGASCFADCNGSGNLNIDDVDCFVAAFVANNLALADCDGSGNLNIDDVDCFVAGFVAGCP